MADQWAAWLDDSKHPGDVSPKSSSFLDNLQNSASNFVGNVASAVTSPVQTVGSIYDVVNGYLDKIPGVKANNLESAMKQQQMADAMTKHFKDRYGSVENIKKTAYEDPIGFAADLSSVLAPLSGVVGAAGEAADVAGLARTASALRTAAKVGTTGAEVTNPLNAAKLPLKGAATVAKVVGATPETVAAISNPVSTGAVNLAKRMYASSLNPVGATARDVSKLAETGLSEGVGPANEAKLWRRIMGHADTVRGMVDEGAAQGLTLDPSDTRANVAAKLLPDAASGGEPGTSFGVQATPAADTSRVENALKEWTDQHFIPATPGTPPQPSTILGPGGQPMGMTPGTPATPERPIPIPIAEGNAIKSGTYQQLSKKSFGKSAAGATEPVPVASEQAQLEIARDLRRQIGDQLSGAGIGDIHGANAAEGNLLDLRPYVEKNAAAAARSGVIGKVGRDALVNKALPGVAMGLYKAGKMDLPTLQYILRQSATGVAQENAQ
jgi:hypothetical protein